MRGEGPQRATVTVAIMVLAVVVGAVAGGLSRQPPSLGAPEASDVDVTVMGTIDVHVAGWVTSPGVVTLNADSIVADAIAAAEGMRPGARSDLVNLAAPLHPGEQIVVPGPDSTGVAPPDDDTIHINSAGIEEMEALPGVGPVLAQRIVSYRDSNGAFDVVEDLLQVPGIGEAKLASIRDFVVVP